MELDLHAAFDASTLRDGDSSIAVVKCSAGQLALPTGAIAVFDPLSVAADEPYTVTVPPGTYAVELLAMGRRFALARVVFSSGTPARWELAVHAGEDARALRPGQIYGFAIDAGTGCIVDASSVESVRNEEIIQMMVTSLNAAGEQQPPILRWPTTGPATVIAFATGEGNAVYPAWWGFAADDSLVELVLDFGLGELSRPTIVDDPGYRREWARARFDELVSAVRDMAAGNDEARMIAFSATAELVSLESDAAEILPDLIRALRSWKHDEVSAEPLIRLAKVLAQHEELQPEIAAWLTTAPKGMAGAFVFEHGLRRMQGDLASVVAKLTTTTSPMLLVQAVTGLHGLEVGREPFRPWLITLAHRRDDVGDAAKRVLKTWGE